MKKYLLITVASGAFLFCLAVSAVPAEYSVAPGMIFTISSEQAGNESDFQECPEVYILSVDSEKTDCTVKQNKSDFPCGNISCVITRSVSAGTYTLYIREKGKGPAIITSDFTVTAPGIPPFPIDPRIHNARDSVTNTYSNDIVDVYGFLNEIVNPDE